MFETFYLTLDIYYPRLATWNLQPLVKKLLPLATIVRLAIFIIKVLNSFTGASRIQVDIQLNEYCPVITFFGTGAVSCFIVHEGFMSTGRRRVPIVQYGIRGGV